MVQAESARTATPRPHGEIRHDPATGVIVDARGTGRLVWVPEELIQALHAVVGRMVHRVVPQMLTRAGLEWGAAVGAHLGPPTVDDARSEIERGLDWTRAIDRLWTQQGLGRLSSGLEGGRQVLHLHDSFVARVIAATGRPVCHLYAGLLSDLFGGLYGRDVACVETRCRSHGHDHCTFVLDEPVASVADAAPERALVRSDGADTAEVELTAHPDTAAGRDDEGARPFARLDPGSGTATARGGTRIFLAPIAFLAGLHRAAAAYASPRDEHLLYQLGYDWGIRHFRNTERALGQAAGDRIADLPIADFIAWIDRWLANTGWGRLSLHEVDRRILVRLDHSALAHALGASGHASHPSCHVWAGMLAGAFSGATGVSLTAVEVDCAAVGRACCRFLLDLDEVVEPIRRLVARGAGFAEVRHHLAADTPSASPVDETPNRAAGSAEVPT